MENMESVSSMKSLGAMDFYDEEDNKTAFLAVRIKEEVELESNQIKDDINNMHDCQQDPDNMQVNELQLFMGKEEEEEDGGNASKVDEGGKTVSVYVDADDMKDEETSPSNMDVRNKNELCTSGVIRMSNLKIGKVYVKHSKEDGGNSSKINEKTKIWSDIPSNEDKDIISKKDGVPEQAQRITGPVCNDIPEKQQDSHNLPSNINSMKRKETVNDKRAGEEEEKGGGNTTKMEEDFKTSIECEDSDAANTPKTDGATENSKEERQDVVNTSDVNDKQAGEEEEKGGGNTTKMEEDFKTITDAVNTPGIDGATEDSEEEGQDGGNIPTVNDKQAGEEEEKGGGNTTKMEEVFKTITDHNGECDSEQDADNSPSCLIGTNSWRCVLSCLFSPPCGFYRMLLLGSLFFLLFPINATNATKPIEYAADSGNIQEWFLCDYFSTPFINTTSKIHCKSRCYNESKKNNCQPGFEGFCLPLVTGKGVIAGCINTAGLHLDGEKCLLVTIVKDHNKYKAECHDKKCPTCTNANSLEERLKRCLFQNETSGDSHSTECSPENSGTTSGCVHPTCWILGLGIAVVLLWCLPVSRGMMETAIV